jgi:hypothetical protein
MASARDCRISGVGLVHAPPFLGIPKESLWFLLTVPIVALWTLGYAFVWIRSGFRGELDATNTIRGKNWLIGAALLGAIIAIAFFHSTPPAQHATLSDPWSAFRPVNPFDQFDRQPNGGRHD